MVEKYNKQLGVRSPQGLEYELTCQVLVMHNIMVELWQQREKNLLVQHDWQTVVDMSNA